MTLEQYNEDGAFSCESLIFLYYGYFVSITLKDINDILYQFLSKHKLLLRWHLYVYVIAYQPNYNDGKRRYITYPPFVY